MMRLACNFIFFNAQHPTSSAQHPRKFSPTWALVVGRWLLDVRFDSSPVTNSLLHGHPCGWLVTLLLFTIMITIHGKVNAMQESSQTNMLRTLNPVHPRLLADAARFERIRELVQSDPRAKAWFASIIKQSDKIMGEPVVAYDIPDGKRLLAVSRRLVDRVYTLGMVWQVTSEPKVLERAWLELSAAAAFPDWNPSHFLDTAEMTAGMAIGYDWLYHGLSAEQRQTLRVAIIKHGLEPGMLSYDGKEPYGWWVRAHNNWNQVCNGGMIAGALAIAEEEPELAATVVRNAVESLPLAMRNFGPDGGWFEGPGYWGYAMMYNALAIACLDSALGTDFGLSRIEGFDRAADFFIQMAGATGKSFNYADAKVSDVQHSSLFWLANKFNRPDWANYQSRHGRPNAEALLWYKPALITNAVADPPGLSHFRGVEVASARTRWNDNQALFIGVKAGRNGVSHDNLDLGSFILEALGERWIIDLGPDDYNLPAYFGQNRYTYYRMRAEGHNTLVVNPGRSQPDQDPKAMCTLITRDGKKDGESVITTDLTPAYAGHGAKHVQRTFLLADNALELTDALELDGAGEAWWFFHTPAAVTLAEDGRSAVLAIGEKRLRVRLESPNATKLAVMDARPLPGSPDPEGQNPNNGAKLLNASREFHIVKVGDTPRWGEPDPGKAIRKLAIHLTGLTTTTVHVVFSPL